MNTRQLTYLVPLYLHRGVPVWFASLPVVVAGGGRSSGRAVTGITRLSGMDGLLLRIGALLRHWSTALSAARRLQGHAGGVEHGIAAQHWSVRAAKGSINKP